MLRQTIQRLRVVALAGALALAAAQAHADCSIIEKLRVAAKQHFRTIAGAPLRLEGETKSTLDVKGGTCKISRDDDDTWASHECTWVLTKDPAVAKAVYDQTVAETASCVISKEPPSRHTSKRSESATLEDAAKTSVEIRYYFDSGFYLLDLEYSIITN